MPPPRRPTISALNSWKEIAAYMGRGVRTVQRWERDLKMPVHRIGSGPRSPACAFPSELETWLKHVAIRKSSTTPGEQEPWHPSESERDSAVAVSRVLLQRSAELAQRMAEVSSVHRQQAQLLRQSFREMKKLLEESRNLAGRGLLAEKRAAVRQMPKSKTRAVGG